MSNRTAKFDVQHVEMMPKELESGILYVSERFGTAAHLCACGCGTKIRTPLAPTEWRLRETPYGPTLRPSIGNWQIPCRTHYLITNGRVEWAGSMSEAEVRAGRRAEHVQRTQYLERKYAPAPKVEPQPSITEPVVRRKGFWARLLQFFFD